MYIILYILIKIQNSLFLFVILYTVSWKIQNCMISDYYNNSKLTFKMGYLFGHIHVDRYVLSFESRLDFLIFFKYLSDHVPLTSHKNEKKKHVIFPLFIIIFMY